MENKLKEFFDTDFPINEIFKKLGVSYKIGYRAYRKLFSKEERAFRHKRLISLGKLKDKNPMFGMTKELHPNYKEEISDGKGYIMILKPDWYTGRKGTKHVFKHTIVMCESLGITELPKGFVIHHIDFDPLNNELSNLALMTNGAHIKLHGMLRRATTISKESRK